MEPFNPFIEYLKQRIFERASADELKGMVDKKIIELKAPEEIIELLNAVVRLWSSRDIDVYYKGGNMDFINYVWYKIEEVKVNKETDKDWIELFKDINNRYIANVSLNDFNEVMNHHRLPNGKEKIRWIAKKSEAVKFLDWFKFEMKEFNQCFISKNRKVFTTHNRTITDSDPKFKKILESY